ncbi:MAG: hypothetical protein ACLFN5_07805, partial [bacterium]
MQYKYQIGYTGSGMSFYEGAGGVFMKKLSLTVLIAIFLVFEISPASANFSQPISSRYQQQSASSIVGPY